MGDMADYYIDQMMSGKMPVGRVSSHRTKATSAPKPQAKELALMENNQNVTVIATVSVHFLQGNTYQTYAFFTDLDLMPDDLVVVDTANGPALARVEMMDKGIHPKATKWVIDRVDIAQHEARIAREKMERELRKKLEKRRKELTDVEVYERLAATDPEMGALLTAYKQVQSGAVVIPQVGNRSAVIPPRREAVSGVHARAVEEMGQLAEVRRIEMQQADEERGRAFNGDPKVLRCGDGVGPAWDNHGGRRRNPYEQRFADAQYDAEEFGDK